MIWFYCNWHITCCADVVCATVTVGVWAPEFFLCRIAACGPVDPAAAAVIEALMPGVKVILGAWLGTRWVIFTDFRPSSVNISVNWLMYLSAWGRVPSRNRHVEPLLSPS